MAITSLIRWATDAAASLPSTVILGRRCFARIVLINLQK